jgi:hypothetical protein
MAAEKLIVLCHRPGLIRGGKSNPAYAERDLSGYTREQLRELLDEPEIVVVQGTRLTADMLDRLKPEPRAEAAEAKKK